MENTNNVYCRLCAESKPIDKLYDLTTDLETQTQISLKLDQLNISSIDLAERDLLPKSVCFVCIESLNRSSNFVTSVVKAQCILRSIFINAEVKIEVHRSDDSRDNFDENSDFGTSSDVKNENPNDTVKDEIKPELDCELLISKPLEGSNLKKRRKGRLMKRYEIVDADIPLSHFKTKNWNDYRFLCKFCNNIFSNVNDLKNHSIDNHGTCCAFKCIDCGLSKFNSYNSYILHIVRHRPLLKQCCNICFEEFSSSHDLKQHISIHSLLNTCKGCNTMFSSTDEFELHTRDYYVIGDGKNSKKFPCEICNKEFKTKGNLKKHIQIHTERPRNHTCDKCGKTYFDKGSLTSHLMVHEINRAHKCEICKAGFHTASQLRQHVSIHDGVKPFSCEQCGRSFRLGSHLKAHRIIHTDSMPYTCKYCSKSFRFRSILTQHIRQHTGAKPYSCEICMREFTNWPNYNKHMKRRHGINMSKKKRTPQGVFPVNPLTGEIQMYSELENKEEWKKKVLTKRSRGRPKKYLDEDNEGIHTFIV